MKKIFKYIMFSIITISIIVFSTAVYYYNKNITEKELWNLNPFSYNIFLLRIKNKNDIELYNRLLDILRFRIESKKLTDIGIDKNININKTIGKILFFGHLENGKFDDKEKIYIKNYFQKAKYNRNIEHIFCLYLEIRDKSPNFDFMSEIYKEYKIRNNIINLNCEKWKDDFIILINPE